MSRAANANICEEYWYAADMRGIRAGFRVRSALLMHLLRASDVRIPKAHAYEVHTKGYYF
jgi:hypothetical protein